MPSILFVCTGNLYRSPFAMAVFNSKLKEIETNQNWVVESAGTWTKTNLVIPDDLVVIASRFGLNLSQHLSKRIDNINLENYDLILVMEKGHKEALKHEFPSNSKRIFMIKEISGECEYIQDPIGLETTVLETIIKELYELISKDFKKFCALATTLSIR